MKPLCLPESARRKAVWGPRRTFAAALVALLAFAPIAIAAPRNDRQAVRAGKPGKPNSNAVPKKMDETLTKRSKGLLSQLGTSKVVVTFKPGFRIPNEFRRYAKRSQLTSINGAAIEVPNRLLKRLSEHPAVAEFHVDRRRRHRRGGDRLRHHGLAR
jgi:hypothetical protein